MNKNYINTALILGATIASTLIIIYLVKRRKTKTIKIVKGEYVVPKGTPNMADALHSFERRKSDGFGGKMSTKIREGLKEMYNNGINPDVTDLKINVDSTNYKVNWEATIEPSKDGKAYLGFMTFGSAGSGADERAINQDASMKQKVDGENYKIVLDFKNPKGVYIRQFFYKYTNKEYPSK